MNETVASLLSTLTTEFVIKINGSVYQKQGGDKRERNTDLYSQYQHHKILDINIHHNIVNIITD